MIDKGKRTKEILLRAWFALYYIGADVLYNPIMMNCGSAESSTITAPSLQVSYWAVVYISEMGNAPSKHV